MERPRFLDDAAFKALRVGDHTGFAELTRERQVLDFSNADFRGTDFRQFDLSRIVLRGAYLKDADLRACDLRHLDLEGTSLHNAKIGGTYFPTNISAAEILLSVQQGTRIRTNSE